MLLAYTGGTVKTFKVCYSVRFTDDYMVYRAMVFTRKRVEELIAGKKNIKVRILGKNPTKFEEAQ